MVNRLEDTFPRLSQGSYHLTSACSRRYNCVAWAVGDDARWWWPGTDPVNEFWPDGLTRAETLDAFQEMFASLGYAICQGEEAEANFEKIAIFATDKNEPKHAARQLSSGLWTSKIGALEDMEHRLHDLDGAEYGTPVTLMKRPKPT